MLMSEAHVRKIYWVNLAVSVFVPLTIVLLKPIIAEPFAFAAGAFLMFLTGFPFNRELARTSGRELTFIKRPRKTGQVVEVEAV
ncbi:MAG: hypothetical protein QXX19_08685, partial [Candidatus Caldarchaeum sp.]